MSDHNSENQPLVLIAGDSRETVEEVSRWVAAETSDFETVFTEDRVIRLARNRVAQLVVLCFESLDDSEHACASLLAALKEEAGAELPALVALCDRNDVERAYALCDAGKIDDYVLFRPLYDPYRLQLVIRNGLRHRRLHRRAEGLQQELKSVGTRVGALDQLSADLQSGSETVLAQAREQLSALGLNLGASIDQACSALDRQAQDGELDAWACALQEELRALREDTLGSGIAGAGTALEKLVVKWVDDHRTRHDDLVNDIDSTCRKTLREAATILLVDDEPFALAVTQRMLENHGYQVLSAENGRRALSLAFSELPALILLDLRLPDLNGAEILQRLKGDPRTHDIPVIVLSGVSEKEVVIKLIRSGLAGYHIKPPREDRLIAQIQQTLAGA